MDQARRCQSFSPPQLSDIMPSSPLAITSRSQSGYWSIPSVVTSAVARDQFEILYPTIRGFLLSQFEAHSMPQDAIEYFTHVCQRPLTPSPSQGNNNSSDATIKSVSTITRSVESIRLAFSWSRRQKLSKVDGWTILNTKRPCFSDG